MFIELMVGNEYLEEGQEWTNGTINLKITNISSVAVTFIEDGVEDAEYNHDMVEWMEKEGFQLDAS